jgi:hypothetical protein
LSLMGSATSIWLIPKTTAKTSAGLEVHRDQL